MNGEELNRYLYGTRAFSDSPTSNPEKKKYGNEMKTRWGHVRKVG